MDITEFTKEIQTMTRAALIEAKDELAADTELPKQVKGQIINEINNRLSALKTKGKPKQEGGFFYSFMSEGEAISAISKLETGVFIVRAEPDALISVYPLSTEQYLEMQEKEWPELV